MTRLSRAESLAERLDSFEQARFDGSSIPDTEKRALVEWLEGRSGIAKSYAGLPAPTGLDFGGRARTFTGELLTTGAATAHVLGEEACRALVMLSRDVPEADGLLEACTIRIVERLRESRTAASSSAEGFRGEYCCGICSCSVWRHMTAGGLAEVDPEEWLEAGMESMKAHRLDNGRWRRFPFYYSLLALTEVDLPSARAEMEHAAPSLERVLSRKVFDDSRYASRRRALAKRVLEVL